MKVRYNGSGDTTRSSSSEKWLTVGRTYEVLVLTFSSDGSASYRLIADDRKTPMLVATEQFTVTDGLLPRNWVIDSRPGRFVEFAPKAWTVEGYWERYFDGDPDAEKAFDEESGTIQALYSADAS